MSKRHILKGKLGTGKRMGEMNYRKFHYMILKVGFQGRPDIEEDILKVLNKHFNIIDLSEKSNKRGRGSITRSKALNSQTKAKENNGNN